jgi:hypothetical protein
MMSRLPDEPSAGNSDCQNLRPNAMMSARPSVSHASAVSGSKPPGTMSVPAVFRANRTGARRCIFVKLFSIRLTPGWHPCILRSWNWCSDARRPSSSLSRSPPLDGPSARAGRPRLRRASPAARAVATVRCTDPPSRAEDLRELSRRPRRIAAAPRPAPTTPHRRQVRSPFRFQRRWRPALSRPWRRSSRRPHHSPRGAPRCLSPSARFRSTFSSPSS